MLIGEEKILVSSHGYSDAALFFLGGHPLKDDLLSGAALSGSIERTLNEFLKPEMLNLKECYRSVFIKEKLEYSGTNPKKLYQALSKIDIKHYEEKLFEEIRDVNPTVIIPLDDIALSAVFPHINHIKKPRNRKFWIYCYRGSVLSLREDWQTQLNDTIRIIPVLGPQILYQDYTSRGITRMDYSRIKSHINRRDPISDFGLVWVARTALQFQEFLDRQLKKHPVRVTFDIETYGGLITCISFCFDSYEAVSVPFIDDKISNGERALLWMLVAKVLNSDLEKNNQNIKYDWTILARHAFNVKNVRSDTMLKGALLYPELPKGLDFYTSVFTEMPYYKDEGKEFNPKLHSRDKLYLYNAKDSLAAHITADEMDKELVETGMKDFYEEEIAPTILIYKNIDETGLLVDGEVKAKLNEKYEELYDSNLTILRGYVGNPDFNARSNPMVGKLLYEELGFPKRTKTDENGNLKYRTDKDTLDELLINYGENTRSGQVGYRIILRTIVCRKLSKVLEYINTPLHPDGRFRGSYNTAGTETGRSSCSKTIDERFRQDSDPKSTKATRRLGRSLQTITKHGFSVDEEVFDDWISKEIASDIRSMFVPRRDFVFVEIDGSQAEARAVAVLSEDYELLADFDRKPKVHAKTAAILFGVDVNIITKNEPKIPKIGIAYYDVGKRTRHARNYKETAFGLCARTHIPLKECDRLCKIFDANNPKIEQIFHQEITQILKSSRTLTTPLGRQRTFFSKYDDALLREAIAYIPQSLISDITKFTPHRVVANLDGYMSKYYFNVEAHDSVLAEVHKGLRDKYIEVFVKQYERPIDFKKCSLTRDFQLTIPCEVSWSAENWMNLQDL